MGVDTVGTVRMRGESDRGVMVRVLIDDSRLRLLSQNELIGEWERDSLGITALYQGFNIRAEGEEFVLVTDDDVAVAEEFGLTTATPRLARKVAASHPPAERVEIEEEPTRSLLVPVALAVAGLMILAGGFILKPQATNSLAGAQPEQLEGASEFWLAFVIGGLVVAAIAYLISTGQMWARVLAIVALAGIIVFFVVAAQRESFDPKEVLGYGFVAGGLVVGVAVVFSGSVTRDE